MSSGNAVLSLIVGNEISSVVFARGYLQIVFDGPYLNAYVWPSIVVGGHKFTFGEPRYRDSLCDQIGKEVVAAIEVPKVKLELGLSDGTTIEISLAEEERNGPEAAMLQDGEGIRWNVW